MKITIWKSEERSKYVLLDFYVKANQGFNLIIINLILVKRLVLKVRFINTLANYCLDIFVANRDSIELKSWVRF